MINHEKILQLNEIIATVAQAEIVPRFLNAKSQIKSDGSLLSEADLAMQAQLAFRLPEIINAPVLGEEMSPEQQKHLWQHNQSGLWIIDPIDGTTNFLNGLPHFAVSVAFVQQGVPQLGVIHNPISQETFYASQGGGAFLNGQKLPLRQSSPRLQDAVAGVEVKRLRSGNLSTRIHTLSPIRSIRSLGSSTLDWCYLAAGRYDVYVHGGQNLWDYAAGALIFTEAGGKLATLEGDDFWSGKHVFKRSAIAAIQPDLFEKWVKWIRENQ
ncbi:inositol monophosphatase family protein [Alysiella filiformis]|uniref:Myo-inositol-1(Or 4)-monophosphatase n=1 Tax=Alysiella filiformis DSM 16848 TaxID=1120981 RepID=A0A286E353_9NEIS|nr:inositol monophosphatase family protein [Alysiella filiformis]QMT31137.1 inositol monophosphatase family protein [Alysiella filiformis]UBQ55871.1 inositol monophosphatase family protein [Alysiella filiformis DSM 16848]SOD65326.1 myo-inositol-1(or 4)-monophosphatase [Alysiella filiformis DSM 16848]